MKKNDDDRTKRLLIIVIAIIAVVMLAGVILYTALNTGDPQIMAPGPIDGPAGEYNPLIM